MAIALAGQQSCACHHAGTKKDGGRRKDSCASCWFTSCSFFSEALLSSLLPSFG